MRGLLGGWGWMLGDDGSACWLVREAARDLLRVADEGGVPGPMGQALMRASGCRSLRELRERLAGWHRPEQWAELAPAIFESAAADATARDIVARGAIRLAALARQVARSVGEAGPVVLAGGLLVGQPLLNELVRDALATVLPQTPVMTLDRPPVHGSRPLGLGRRHARGEGGLGHRRRDRQRDRFGRLGRRSGRLEEGVERGGGGRLRRHRSRGAAPAPAPGPGALPVRRHTTHHSKREGRGRPAVGPEWHVFDAARVPMDIAAAGELLGMFDWHSDFLHFGIAVFEAVHGTAPDIAGKQIANPTALLLSAVLMLRHLDEDEAADRIMTALRGVLVAGKTRTRDLGGVASTVQFADAICRAIA